MTAFGTIEGARRAMRAGAYDFLKPNQSTWKHWIFSLPASANGNSCSPRIDFSKNNSSRDFPSRVLFLTPPRWRRFLPPQGAWLKARRPS